MIQISDEQMDEAGYEKRMYGNGNFVGWGWFPIPWWKKLWRRFWRS